MSNATAQQIVDFNNEVSQVVSHTIDANVITLVIKEMYHHDVVVTLNDDGTIHENHEGDEHTFENFDAYKAAFDV